MYELMFALNSHNNRVARIMLEDVQDINERDYKGASYIHMARSVPMIQLLLKKGADINLQDNDGHTALHYARTDKICRFLIDCGIDLTLKDNKGWLGLDGFDAQTRHTLMEHWRRREALRQQELFSATFMGQQAAGKVRVL